MAKVGAMGVVRVARARGTSIDRQRRQCGQGQTGQWEGVGHNHDGTKSAAHVHNNRHNQDERGRGLQPTAHIRSGSMLPDLSSEMEHSDVYCACLEGMGHGGGRNGEGVGGWHGHDTERGHGGCDG